MKLSPCLVALTLSLGCASAPATPAEQPATPATPAGEPAPVAVQSEAIARADALLEDMHRKEAALAEFDRANPYTEPDPRLRLVRLRQSVNAVPSVGAVANATSTTADPAAPSRPAVTEAAAGVRNQYSSNVTASDHDESWWKNEMHAREVRYQESLARTNAARASMLTAKILYDRATTRLERATAQSGYQDAEAAYQLAVRQAANDQSEIDGFRDVARRNAVPPGWLRWP